MPTLPGALPHRVNTLPKRGVELDMEAGEGGVDPIFIEIGCQSGPDGAALANSQTTPV